jgi:ribosome-interacting GTPase 1
VVARYARSLVELLQETLERLELTQALKADDPYLIELKKHIARTIAELEVAKSRNSHAA